MDNVIFKSTDAAFEYALEYFVKNKLSLNASFIGIVKEIENKDPEGYLVEIICKAGNFLKRKNTMLVTALQHPDFRAEIKQNDLVIFGPSDISGKMPAGYLINKLEPEYDTQKEQFKISNEKNIFDVDKTIEAGIDLWRREVDHKYGLLFQESEIIESDNHLYFCQTNHKKLCAGWDKEKERWEINLDRSSLEGLSFTTPKRFDQIVFGNEGDQQRHYRKQYLIEYLLFGLNIGEIKTLTKEVDNGAKIEFSLEARTWNGMLIGNSVGVEGGMCKYFEQNSQDERILHFALLCTNWDVNIELILGEYEEYEQHNFGIKDFGGYYN